MEVGLRSTGAHTEDPGQSAPGLERWAFRLVSKCKAKSNISNTEMIFRFEFFAGVKIKFDGSLTSCQQLVIIL